jgi:6-pyruvoyltetrahydropterin/6-carboxytetrahydropterin synthase
MEIRIFREYQLKFYLNARRFMIYDGVRSEIRPNTWEFSLHIRVGRGSIIAFGAFEDAINGYLSKYQNCLLNEVEPFGEVLPTMENITICFTHGFRHVISELGGRLIRVETSKSPTRSYILNLEGMEDRPAQEVENQILSQVVDAVLDDLLMENEGIMH